MILFLSDIAVDNELYRDILLDRLHVNEGMLMENIVAQELRAYGHRLFFYSRSDTDSRENNMEIDFLIRRKEKDLWGGGQIGRVSKAFLIR